MKSDDLDYKFISSKAISIVVPVYNSEHSLSLLIERLESALTNFCQDFEVILVNDGSQDNSWNVITKLAERFCWVKGINLMRNYGQHNALLCGIKCASKQLIVTMDDDLQNPPEEIQKLIVKISEGYDVVYGTPKEQQHGIWRNLASSVTKMALGSIMGVKTATKVSAFRAFKTELRDSFRQYQGSFVSIDVLLTWGTTRFSSVPVHHEPRPIGKTNYSFSSLFLHAINMLTGFSILPLQVASFLGFACTVFGLCVLIYVLSTFFIYGTRVPGFPFLASIIAIFSGAQLIALGIMGEYLARMHFRSLGKPSSVIRETTGIQTGQISNDEQ